MVIFIVNILPCKPCYTAKEQGEGMTKIGILHPGEMGVSIAASAVNSGHHVYWAMADRSDKTRQRANEHVLLGLEFVGTLPYLRDYF
jgi:hypothetical protein